MHAGHLVKDPELPPPQAAHGPRTRIVGNYNELLSFSSAPGAARPSGSRSPRMCSHRREFCFCTMSRPDRPCSDPATWARVSLEQEILQPRQDHGPDRRCVVHMYILAASAWPEGLSKRAAVQGMSDLPETRQDAQDDVSPEIQCTPSKTRTSTTTLLPNCAALAS